MVEGDSLENCSALKAPRVRTPSPPHFCQERDEFRRAKPACACALNLDLRSVAISSKYQASLERWPRGRRRRFAKPLYGLKPVSGVRISPSPQNQPRKRSVFFRFSPLEEPARTWGRELLCKSLSLRRSLRRRAGAGWRCYLRQVRAESLARPAVRVGQEVGSSFVCPTAAFPRSSATAAFWEAFSMLRGTICLGKSSAGPTPSLALRARQIRPAACFPA